MWRLLHKTTQVIFLYVGKAKKNVSTTTQGPRIYEYLFKYLRKYNPAPSGWKLCGLHVHV